jgi:acyl carrier protein
MPANDCDTRVVWDTLWQSLDGSRYDIDVLRARAHDDSHLVEDMGMDSLDLLEFYLRLDEKFHMNLAAEDYPKFTSVTAIADYLRSKST